MRCYDRTKERHTLCAAQAPPRVVAAPRTRYGGGHAASPYVWENASACFSALSLKATLFGLFLSDSPIALSLEATLFGLCLGVSPFEPFSEVSFARFLGVCSFGMRVFFLAVFFMLIRTLLHLDGPMQLGPGANLGHHVGFVPPIVQDRICSVVLVADQSNKVRKVLASRNLQAKKLTLQRGFSLSKNWPGASDV